MAAGQPSSRPRVGTTTSSLAQGWRRPRCGSWDGAVHTDSYGLAAAEGTTTGLLRGADGNGVAAAVRRVCALQHLDWPCSLLDELRPGSAGPLPSPTAAPGLHQQSHRAGGWHPMVGRCASLDVCPLCTDASTMEFARPYDDLSNLLAPTAGVLCMRYSGSRCPWPALKLPNGPPTPLQIRCSTIFPGVSKGACRISTAC